MQRHKKSLHEIVGISEEDWWRSYRQLKGILRCWLIRCRRDVWTINKEITFKDYLYYYQNRAFGTASIDKRSHAADITGVQLKLVTGAVLDDFRYLSTSTCPAHQHSVISSGSLLYYHDTLLTSYQKSRKKTFTV